jgi:UDP:flavonoid glycosyltransferase YjiC (YdhE family)
MRLEDVVEKNVLISPLNWGMGHVSRSIALISKLRDQKNRIIFAGDQDQIRMVSSYFDDFIFLEHEGYPFRFGEKGNFGLDLAFSYPSLNKRLKQEIIQVNDLVKEYFIDLVISDHRYGFYSGLVPSIFLSHQVNLPVRWHEQWVQKIHHNLISKFSAIWIPDHPDSRLSGDLSKEANKFNSHFIGPLSRFEHIEENRTKDISSLLLISGPEVYGEKFMRSKLEAKESEMPLVLVSPLIKEKYPDEDRIVATKNWKETDGFLLRAEKVIAPSGYSTIMDLEFLKIEAELQPTPGQREQEYLFKLWNKKSLG